MGNMKPISGSDRDRNQRRGVVAVYTLVLLVVMLGFAALTIDVGVMYNTRADLQKAADAAAMAGASTFTSDTMMKVRMGEDGSNLLSAIRTDGSTRAAAVTALNASFGTKSTAIDSSDLTLGWLDPGNGTAIVHTGASLDVFNAVKVTVRRDVNGPNGPVSFLFAPIFGKVVGETGATATAIFDDRVAGVDVGSLPGNLLPFSIHRDIYEDDFVNGGDLYSFNPDLDVIDAVADGIPEINLYPHDSVPGNFGILNIGVPNVGTTEVIVQIENGVSPDQVEAEIGSSELKFFGEDQNPITYDITGTPGMVSSLTPAIESRIGQIVGFLLHDVVLEEGSNSVFTVTDIRFGRVMDINLVGAPSTRGLFIQPCTYEGSGVIIDKNAPSSGGLYGLIYLAR